MPHGPSRPRGRRGSGKGKNANRRNIIVAVIALLVGVAVFCYPMVSNYLHEQNTSHVVAEQASTVSAEDEATLEAARQVAIAYNQKLLDSRTVVTDPFDPNAQRVTNEEYESVLNLAGDGVMGTITIPKIQVQMPIYHGTSSEVLEQGVGHLQETSVPIGGESTHAVLSGHTGLPSAKIFDNLDQLEVGDYFIITVLGEDHAYRVTSTEVVLPDETDSLVIQPGKDLCTLVTCTPYGINTHRLLVHAERCDVPDEWLNKGDAAFPAGYSNPPDKALLPSILIGLLLAALIIGGYTAIQRVRSKRAAAPTPPTGSTPTLPTSSARGGGPKHYRTEDAAGPGTSRFTARRPGGTAGARPVPRGRHQGRRGGRHG
ncbi:class C sortase [Olsenella uli]|uniref:class C sortase n=1 Tax=Olsenella uli TaxID=133926 RepID=UPI00195907B1|nr:class C sortase [Olsenella uli]MBM6676272.1 class C sortase [Olsenella uli]